MKFISTLLVSAAAAIAILSGTNAVAIKRENHSVVYYSTRYGGPTLEVNRPEPGTCYQFNGPAISLNNRVGEQIVLYSDAGCKTEVARMNDATQKSIGRGLDGPVSSFTVVTA